jgi:hypothetical protein
MSFVRNLFDDMRERHLLPVVALLIVALIAVPILMGGGSDEAAPPPSSAATASVAPPLETDPVVLASEPELRAFKKRLADFQTTNPFNQHVKPEEDAAASDSASDALPTDSVTGTTTDPGATDPGDIPPLPVDPGDPGDPGNPGGDPAPVDPGDDGGGVTLITTRIDVRVGPVGKTKVVKDVKFLDFLPDRKTPVVQYLQGDFDETNAVFIVSSFVLNTEGDGKCAPSPDRCEFLQMEVGDTQSFQYSDGERYTLTLIDSFIHEEPADGKIPDDAGRVPDFAAQSPVGKVVDE